MNRQVESQVEKNERRRKKIFYVSFAVVTVIFMQFQISRLWLHRKRLQFTPEELKQRQEVLERKLAYRRPSVQTKEVPSPNPTFAYPAESKSSTPPRPDPSPIPAPASQPLPEFTYPPRLAQSRIYAYFVRNKSQIKIDLFYEIYPSLVNQVLSEVSRCPDKDRYKTTIKLNIKSFRSRAADAGTSDYIGFLFKDASLKDGNGDLILISKPNSEMAKNLKLLGGVISDGSAEYDERPSGGEIVYSRSNILITYVENEDSNEQYALFKKAIDQLKTGCNE